MSAGRAGKLIGVGVGPGDPELMTLKAIRALAEKQVDVASLIYRRTRIEQGVEAMELAARADVLKVILTME